MGRRKLQVKETSTLPGGDRGNQKGGKAPGITGTHPVDTGIFHYMHCPKTS